MRQCQLVNDVTGSVEGINALIYRKNGDLVR